jgi:VanZ family protein
MGRVRTWGPTLAWAVFIILVMTTPARSTPPAFSVPGLDKLVHAVLFAVLMWLASHAQRTEGGAARIRWSLVATLAVFATLVELSQALVPGRVPDGLDWMANLTGIGLMAYMTSTAAPRRRETLS